VISFYYHSEFYKLGWIPLLIIGSLITFITLKAILWVNYNKFSGGVAHGTLIFQSDEVDAIKLGRITQLIRPRRESNIKPETIYRAKLNLMSNQFFAELLIKKVIIKKIKDITENDIFLTGAISLKDFKDNWIKRYGFWKPDSVVRVIRFETIS
jgi:hypothetical protein